MARRKDRHDDVWADDIWLDDCGDKVVDSRKVRRHRKAKSSYFTLPTIRKTLFFVVPAAALAIGSAVLLPWVYSATFSDRPEAAPSYYSAVSADDLADPDTSVSLRVPSSDLIDSGYLALINRHYSLPVMPSRTEMKSAYPSLPVLREDIKVHSTVYDALADLLEAAASEGVGPFQIISGFRDYEHQRRLHARNPRSMFSLPAGHSEHHTGLAVDIVPSSATPGGGALSIQLDGSSECERWLTDNSWRFGFILRYPEGRSNITGVAFEPWHFRYVGSPHAYYMWRYDLTLEEYLQRLATEGIIEVVHGERRYEIRYFDDSYGTVYVPEGRDFLLSNNNSGGYIVTAWTYQ